MPRKLSATLIFVLLVSLFLANPALAAKTYRAERFDVHRDRTPPHDRHPGVRIHGLDELAGLPLGGPGPWEKHGDDPGPRLGEVTGQELEQ